MFKFPIFNKTTYKKFALFLVIMIILFLFVLADFALAKKCTTDNDCQKLTPEQEAKGLRTIQCVPTKTGEKECVRALEIKYPTFGKEKLTTEVIVEQGLPAYVKYIFSFAVGLIGLIIFGALVYNGILYLTSAGSVEKMADAKNGITAAFLGGLLLLSSVLIFNTINPQLRIMELPKVEPLEQVVMPGVYICKHNVDQMTGKNFDIGKTLTDYINATGAAQIEAAKKLREIIRDAECPIVNFSGNLQNFQVAKDGDKNTIFIVPSIKEIIDPETGVIKGREAEFQYGLVLHEKENFGGGCNFYPKPEGGNSTSTIYHQIDGYSAQNLLFTARSVTLFQKSFSEPDGEEIGVTLYKGFNYNRDEPATTTEKNFPVKAGRDAEGVLTHKLGDLKDNSRSISFSPAGSYFALLFEGGVEEQKAGIFWRIFFGVGPKTEEVSGGTYGGRCRLLYKNNPNLLDVLPTSGNCSIWSYFNPFNWLKDCNPVLGSMIVIKGTVL